MTDCLYLHGGHVFLPDRVERNGAVLVRQGLIVHAGAPVEPPEGTARVDAEGGYILPGFIDLHVHGGGGHDFMDNTPQAMRAIARVHCAHGTTAMLPTTLASGWPALESMFDTYRGVAKEGTGSADFLGVHLEGPYFAPSKKGAQPERFLCHPDAETVERVLSAGGDVIRRWDAAPELPGMRDFARRVTAHGVVASVAHTDATAEEAEAAFSWGFAHITHFFCAMTERRRLGQRIVAGVMEAALLAEDITLEMIADGIHVPRESFMLAYKVKGAGRIALITDAIRAAGTDDTRSILGSAEEGMPVLVEDGVAKLPDRSFFAGSVATMDRALRVAMAYGVPEADAVRMCAGTPARLAGVEKRKGSLAPGQDADIVLMDNNWTVQRVYVRGRLCHDTCET